MGEDTEVTADAIQKILTEYRTWAVVGCSPDPGRYSNAVARFLEDHGYDVIPVNPTESEVLGRTCYPDLASIPSEIEVEVVDIFRRSEHAGDVVDAAIERGAKAVWMQLDVVDADAAARAEAAGLLVVMDRCPKIELPGLVTR